MKAGGRRYERRGIESAAALKRYCEELLGSPARLSLPLAVNLALVRNICREEQRETTENALSKSIASLFV
jgi:hypothetical protein